MRGLKKKKIFVTPPVAAAQIIFADVPGSGSNCYSTTTVDRVALILVYPFPPNGVNPPFSSELFTVTSS